VVVDDTIANFHNVDPFAVGERACHGAKVVLSAQAVCRLGMSV
jgi:cystathionine beta-lyase/cystathionine gamma-synthase